MPNDEQTSLHKASMKNDCSYITEKTVTSEDLLNTYLGNTPLLWGVASSSVSFVLALLDLPDTTHVNVKSTSGNHLNTPLILSVSKGWTHVSTQGKDTKSQMHIATKLLQKGAEVNGIDVYGRTALHYACLHRNFEAISVLVKAGAAWNIKDKNSQTPLDFCCMSCKTALNILQIATGGVENYTYTLVKNNFHSSDTFYQSLSDLLAKDGQFIDVQLLKQSYQFNQKIDFALAPIYNHARKLFERDNQNISFERYAKNFMNPVFSPEIIDSVGSCKMKALLTLYFELKNTGSARIDFSGNEIISNIQKEEIEKILNHALKNPELRAERELLIEIGIAILNLVSILCAGLPLLVNYYITGQLFFSHRTKTEELELLNHLKGEITTCIQGIPSLSTSKP